jgi:excisionase family DNA binding protein
VSIADAAATLALSTWTIRQLIAQGKLAARKFGKRTLPEFASLQKYARSLPKARLASIETAPSRIAERDRKLRLLVT